MNISFLDWVSTQQIRIAIIHIKSTKSVLLIIYLKVIRFTLSILYIVAIRPILATYSFDSIY